MTLKIRSSRENIRRTFDALTATINGYELGTANLTDAETADLFSKIDEAISMLEGSTDPTSEDPSTVIKRVIAKELRGELNRRQARQRKPRANTLGNQASTPSKRKVGRPKGSGSMEASDQPFIEEMDRLMSDDPDLSIRAAAARVADSASGASYESTVARLSRRYIASKSPSRKGG